MQPTTSPYIEVRESKIHATGIFAAKDIPKGARIIEYVGRKVNKDESDEVFQERYDRYENDKEHTAGVFLFELNKKYDLDGDVTWNTARFINHSCDPNAETMNDRHHIWIVAIKDIPKGEEITYNYGYNIDAYEDHPCWCGSKNCVGYIVSEDDRPELLRRLKEKEKRKNQ